MTSNLKHPFSCTENNISLLLRLHRKEIKNCNNAILHPKATQEIRFKKLISLSKGSEFWKKSGGLKLSNLEDIRDLPITQYDDYRHWIERIVNGEANILTREKVLSLMETSGTTGSAKLIPVTKSWTQSIQSAQRLWLLDLLCRSPQLAHGKSLSIVSSENSRLSSGGIPIGANTGRMKTTQPWWAQKSFVLPRAIQKIKCPKAKQYATLRFALQEPIMAWTTANPSMILLYCRRLIEWKPFFTKDLRNGSLKEGPAELISPAILKVLEKDLRVSSVPMIWKAAEIWPLQVINCWRGGPAAYFVDRLPEAIGASLPINEIGITASEGFFSIPFGDGWGGGVFWSGGHVVEFIDSNDNPHFAWELSEGEQYRLVISTENGLWRYDLNDTVEVSRMYQGSPCLTFMGKSGRFLNAVGEKLSEGQVSKAMSNTCREYGLTLVGFTARIKWGEVPHYIVTIEGDHPIPTQFAHWLESELMRENIEYETKRKTERLNPLQIERLQEGAYDKYRAYLLSKGAPDGQIKDLIIAINDTEWDRFLEAQTR